MPTAYLNAAPFRSSQSNCGVKDEKTSRTHISYSLNAFGATQLNSNFLWLMVSFDVWNASAWNWDSKQIFDETKLNFRETKPAYVLIILGVFICLHSKHWWAADICHFIYAEWESACSPTHFSLIHRWGASNSEAKFSFLLTGLFTVYPYVCVCVCCVEICFSIS